MGEPAISGAVLGDAPIGGATVSWIRPGALTRFYAWCDGLPWHGWWLYPAMAGVLLLWANGILWLVGRLPVGTFDPTLSVSVVYGPYTLGAIGYLNGVAKRALDAFWPATGWPERDKHGWEDAFTTVRAGLALPSLIVGLVVAVGAFLSAPPTVVGGADRGGLAYALAFAPLATFGYAAALLAIAHTSRQLRLVVKIHQEARAIDPFHRRPVYAFSWFTVQIGLAFLLSGYYTIAVNGPFQSGNLIGLAVLGSIIALGAACFVLPLWGIHRRLVREKETLLNQVEDRAGKLVEELYRRIDLGEFDGTKVINEAIAAAGTARERIAKLPTWPWPPQLLRGFLSALLLPVIVYLVSRIVGGQIGA